MMNYDVLNCHIRKRKDTQKHNATHTGMKDKINAKLLVKIIKS